MATYNITTGSAGSPVDVAALGARVNGDILNINGGYALLDIDSRYGLNGANAAGWGNIVGSASLGGTLEINSTKVRLIQYSSGTGNVPAADTVISQGSASGKLIGVYSAMSAAPTAAGNAMPATGWIKIRSWNSVNYAAGALTGIGATAAGQDGPGWIEVVGVDAGLITINRLNKLLVRGDYYYFGGVTTTGARTGTYQIPSNGSAVCYFPGVEVETWPGSNTYTFYPCAGSLTALAANIRADKEVCWISTAGVLRFGHDGTNSTGGYCPQAGCNIRIPNIFMVCCVSATAVNVIPNATLATRYEFAVSGGGVIDMDKVSCNWYLNLNQGFDIKLTNVSTFEAVILTECASPIAWSNVGVGMTAANSQVALTMSLNFAGGTMDNCTWVRANQTATGHYVTSWSDCAGFQVTNEETLSLVKATNATAGSMTLTRVSNSDWTNPVIGGGRVYQVTCDDVNFKDVFYFDHPATTTGTSIPMYMFDIATACNNCKWDGVLFEALYGPYSGILNIGAAGCKNLKLRNIGTANTPRDFGSSQKDATWSNSGTTTINVVTPTAHGLKVNDIIYVLISSNTTYVTVGAKTVTAVGSTTAFSFVNVTGTSSGTLTYYPTMTASLFVIAAGAAVDTLKVQRCYTSHSRSVIATGDNSSKNILLESVWGSEWAALLAPELNATLKNIVCTPALTAQTSVYGTHWFDYFTTKGDAFSNRAYTQSTTTATITSLNHGLRTGGMILVTYSSNTSIIVLGVKTITATVYDKFTFTCLTGSTTGTIDYTPLNGRVAIQMNEPTADTASQVSLQNGAAFTSAGSLYMPTINQQADFICPHKILAHASFPIAEAVMAGGTIGNYDITYSLDDGSTYHNLYYPRAGGTGTSGQYTFTVTNATGVEIGDYAWGTNIGYNARVTNVVSNTVTVDKANIGTVSGVIRFNHLPSETISDPTVGFSLRVRIKTSTTNATAITSLYFYTFSTSTNRQAQYPLDTNTVTFTGLPTGCDAVVLSAGTGTVLDQKDQLSGTSYAYTFSGAQSVDVGFIKPGYVPYYFRNLSLTAVDSSIPVTLTPDRNYI